MTAALLEMPVQHADRQDAADAAAQAALDAELAVKCAELPPAPNRPGETHGRPAAVLAYIDHMLNEGVARIAQTAAVISWACGEHPMTGLPRHPQDAVLGWWVRADEMGAAWPRVTGRVIEGLWTGELIPNATLREVFLAQAPGPHLETFGMGEQEERGLTACALAERVQVIRTDAYHATIGRSSTGDGTRIERYLGVSSAPGKPGYRKSLRVFLPVDVATTITHALALPPHAVGI